MCIDHLAANDVGRWSEEAQILLSFPFSLLFFPLWERERTGDTATGMGLVFIGIPVVAGAGGHITKQPGSLEMMLTMGKLQNSTQRRHFQSDISSQEV